MGPTGRGMRATGDAVALTLALFGCRPVILCGWLAVAFFEWHAGMLACWHAGMLAPTASAAKNDAAASVRTPPPVRIYVRNQYVGKASIC